jgi:hypothetical protein
MLVSDDPTTSFFLCTLQDALDSMPTEFDSIQELEKRRRARPMEATKDALAAAERIPLETLFGAYNLYARIALPSPALSNGVWEVVLAVHARDYLTADQYALLVGPFEDTFGPVETGMQTRKALMGRRF